MLTTFSTAIHTLSNHTSTSPLGLCCTPGVAESNGPILPNLCVTCLEPLPRLADLLQGTAVTRTVAVESGAFVLTASNVISEAGMQTNAIKGLTVEAKEGESAAGHIKPGGGLTAIYAPDGRQISAEIADDVETIVYADLDPDMVPFAALCQDTVGHYSRPDMFQLIVKSAPAPRVVYQQPDGTVRGPPSRIKPFAQLQADASAAHSI